MVDRSDTLSLTDRLIWKRSIDNQIIIMTWLLSPIFFGLVYLAEGLIGDIIFIPILLSMNGLTKLIWYSIG